MSRRLRTTTAPDTVTDLIWQHAAHAPDSTAVIDAAGTTVTYHQLTRRADAVAAELTAAGVAADEVVGVCWPRSVDGLVQLLGVWRSGGAVLYLDPAWPVKRLQYMAAACAVRRIRGAGAGPDLPIDVAPRNAIAGLEPVRGPLAYVVFTSGSTGTPNGVLIEHPGVLNMAQALAGRIGVGAGTRVLQTAAWSWDAAMCEILMTLTAGGTLVLAPDNTRTGGPALTGWLRDHQVQVATLTPSVLAALPASDLPDLRTVVAVGEPCQPRIVQRWAAPHRRIFNGYGPTEATVAVTVGELHPGQDVHIGTPLPGVTVRIVDPDGRVLPAGVTGELLVGGIGVARGYAANPAVTAGRFTVDPDGQRWYHTGDLAAQRPDGTLTYHGRRDDQIKLRGHRLDLGEVEQVLATHPAVLGCAVVAVADRLTAFIAVNYHEDGPPEPRLAAALRAHAAAALPPFAVPDIRVVPALPLTAGGKIDREALRAHADPRPTPDGDSPTADGSLPAVLRVVATVLDLPVHPDTDIIDAGGHSLLVAQLCVALSEKLGVEVPYIVVATNRSPAQIATAIDDLACPPHTRQPGHAGHAAQDAA